MKNLYFNNKGEITKIGYKTERGLITAIKKMNKQCIKWGTQSELDIILPVKRSHNQKLNSL